MYMRKLTSLIGALLISVGFSSSALVTDYSTVSAAKNPVPPSPVSLEKAEPSGFTLLRDGEIKMGGGKTAALTPLRKKSAAKAASLSSAADLAGDWVQTYATLVSPGADGGQSVRIETVADEPNTIKIVNFYDLGIEVTATVDVAAGTISIPNQKIIELDEYGWLDVVALVQGDDPTLVSPDRSKNIEGVINDDGTISITSWWGIFVVEGEYANSYFGIFGNSLFERSNATMTQKALTGEPFTYNVIAEQTSPNILSVKNFGNYGMTVELMLNSDKSSTIVSQVARRDNYGDDYYTNAVSYTQAGQATGFSGTIITEAATDNRTVSWKDWTLKNSTSYLGVLTEGSLTVPFDIVYPELTVSEFEGEGTEASPFLVKTLDDLLLLSAEVNNVPESEYNAVNADGVKYSSAFEGKYFRLEKDIDMGGYRFTPIGNDWYHHFSGTFDGNNHKLTGLDVSTGDAGYAALFGRAGEESVIKNLTVENPMVKAQGNYAAAIAGWSDGMIDNCHVTGARIENQGRTTGGLAGIVVTVTNSSVSKSTVIGLGGNVGGFASEVDALIENCNATETNVLVASPSETYPSGGLVGSLYEAVARNCYFSGIVDAVTYDTGGYIGGIAGTCLRGDIENCFFVGEMATSLQNSAIGGIAGSLYGSIKNSYSVGAISNASSLKTGGLVGSVGYYEGEDGTVYQSSISDCYTVTSVKAYTTGYDAENDMREVIGAIQEGAVPEISDIYFNRQISNFGSVKYGMNTSELTKAAGIAGFDASAWIYTEGQYPRLKGIDENEAAYMSASVIAMGDGNSLNKISKNVELMPMGNTEYLIYKNDALVTEGDFCSIVDDEIQIKDQFGTERLIVRNGMVSYELSIKIAPIPYEGEGTEQSPFLLKTKDDILTLQDITNNKGQYFAGTYFKLANDIDMEYDESFVGICFDPVAATDCMFAGTFDGDGHSITRLLLDKVVWTTRPEDDTTGKGGKPDNMQSTATGAFSGFFGKIGVEGVVKNLTIAADAKLSFWSTSGAIAGGNYGRIENCRNYADVVGYSSEIGGFVGRNQKGAVITGCYNAGNVTSGYQSVGGISGYDQGTVENCANVGTITVDEISQGFMGTKMKNNAGGISGTSNGSIIRNVVNAGTVYAAGGKSGGISGSFIKISHTLGSGTNDMSNAVNYGMVPVLSTADNTTIGALAGNPGTQGAVHDNYWDSQIIIIGAIGNADLEGMNGVETSVLTSGTPLEGFDSQLWDFTAGQYPVLKQFADEELLAKARKVVVTMEAGITAKDMSRDAQLSDVDGLVWSLKEQNAFTIEGNVLKSPVEVQDLTVNTLVADWDGYKKEIEIKRAPDVPLAGEGTAENPYQITSAADWNNLSDYMTTVAESLEGKFLKVTADIDFTDTEFKMLASDGVTVFNGSLDGGKKRISGISFTPTAAFQGAICTVGESGSVSNLTLAGDVETAMASTGGFTGEVYGTLINCVNEINVNSTKGDGVSGFGRLYATARLTDCVNKGNISGTGTNIAGLSAEVDNGVELIRCGNEGTVTNNAKGNYTAGLIAEAHPIYLEECYNKGDVVTQENSAKNVAGLIAYATASSSDKGTMELYRCWNEGDVTGLAVVGGLIAATTSSTTTKNPLILTECYNTGTITAYATATQGASSSPTAGLAAFYNIGSQFIDCYNEGAINSTNQYTAGIAAYPKAKASVDSPTLFSGCYNVGKIVSTNHHAAGIVGNISDYVTVQGCYNKADVEGRYGLGGIVGTITAAPNGKIKDSWNSGNITTSLNRAGGIFGYTVNGAPVENCFNVGDVKTTCEEVGTSTTASGFAIGGIAGQGGAPFVNCYNMGTVTGANRVGGLVGAPYKNRTTIVNSYNAGNIVCGDDECGALIGVDLSDGTLWAEDNKVEGSYFVTDYGTYPNSTVGTAVTVAELAKLEELGEGWTMGDAYTLPMLSNSASVSEALINAVTVGFADGDSKDLVTQNFFVGAPEGVVWSASVPNITFSGTDAVFSSEAFEGKAVLTAAAGELTREFEINCNKTVSGIDEIGGKVVVNEVWFNAIGVQVPEPVYRDGAVYMVIRTYDDGSVETVKVFNAD